VNVPILVNAVALSCGDELVRFVPKPPKKGSKTGETWLATATKKAAAHTQKQVRDKKHSSKQEHKSKSRQAGVVDESLF